MRFYYGLRLGKRGLRPYAGVSLFSWSPGHKRYKPVRQAQHRVVMTYACSHCGHLNPPDAKFCNGCGAQITGVDYSQVPAQYRPR